MSIEAEAELVALEATEKPRSVWDNILMIVTVLVTLGMMIHVVLNALLRAFTNSPIYGTLEITQFWYVPAIASLGFVLAQLNHEHIEARLLFDRIPLVVQPYADIATRLLTLVIAALLAWFGAKLALESMAIGKTAGVSGVTIWPATFFLPISFAALAIVIAVQIVKTVRTARTSTSQSIEGNQ